ncbi:peptidoglycan editing factor PgeF [Psychromonas antarctica]|uniref:peptidoglycan editing factor PgeF n=1 Tax=Psychromonas antarctica TaxID=67573 RepID=UPI001EE88BA8|nr:peptidoglycan editing factor PgeF [Psychromonas antarctica]MCG6201132.1 peptidoglycan editing factor PgeF [Psychromonas antarctica]
MLKFITPNWSAPAHIHAFSTTRLGGSSRDPYQGLNLALHVQDDPVIVLKNRILLADSLALPGPLFWLKQTHSTNLLKLDADSSDSVMADAIWTPLKNKPCIVMTADCLPVLITDKKGSFVSAIHAGWRGLSDGIIEQSIVAICDSLKINSTELLVWLGPCIGRHAFQVGNEVRAEFIAQDKLAVSAFTADKDRWLADLQQLAMLRLAPFNITQITRSDHCTFTESELFYSYRRDGNTGRMASLIWID